MTKLWGGIKRKSKLRGHSDICFSSKEEMIDWVLSQKNFKSMWEKYTESGHLSEFKPSIDRLDNSLGYVDGNLELVTWGENYRRWTISEEHMKQFDAARKLPKDIIKGSKHHNAKVTEKDIPVIRKMSSLGVSQRKIASKFGINQRAVWSIIHKETWSHI